MGGNKFRFSLQVCHCLSPRYTTATFPQPTTNARHNELLPTHIGKNFLNCWWLPPGRKRMKKVYCAIDILLNGRTRACIRNILTSQTGFSCGLHSGVTPMTQWPFEGGTYVASWRWIPVLDKWKTTYPHELPTPHLVVMHIINLSVFWLTKMIFPFAWSEPISY